MKSTHFIIKKKPKPINNQQEFKLSLLPAYAIEYAKLNVNGQANMLETHQVQGDAIIWETGKNSYVIGDDWDVCLEIAYHGIRDHSLLFPQISGHNGLAKRLGEFYDEAEKSFDNKAWLSYALMCGGIFEGLLIGSGCTKWNFDDKITEARGKGIIDVRQEQIINSTREARNKIHANKCNDPYILRKEAFDIMATMDQLIKSFAGC